MAPKSDRKWCETTPIQSIISSYLAMCLFHANTFQLAILGPIISRVGSSKITQLQTLKYVSTFPMDEFYVGTTRIPSRVSWVSISVVRTSYEAALY